MRWLKGGLVVVGAIALAFLLWSLWNHLALMDWIKGARPVPFFLVLALAPAVGVPMTPFFLLAGASFGVRTGLWGTLLALGVNLALCYAIARWMRPLLIRLLRRFGYELPAARQRSAFRLTLGVKLAPGLPAFVKHYALGVAGVPFAMYFGLSMLITGAYAISLVVVGESLFAHEGSRALGAAALVVVVAAALWWRRRRQKRTAHDTSMLPTPASP